MILHVGSFIYGVIAGSTLIAIISWAHINKVKKIPKVSETRNDCVLFSPQGNTLNCLVSSSTTSCNFLSCSACNYKKVLNLIKGTKSHLDICVYLITLEELTKVVIHLVKKGVFVRIITDKQMSEEATNCKVFTFIKNHIPIKIINTSEIMHNKFVIIDRKKLLTGSFNWTKQGVCGNFENGLIIHDMDIVKKFTDYFQNLWLTPFRV